MDTLVKVTGHDILISLNLIETLDLYTQSLPGCSKPNKNYRLHFDVPQGSVLDPLLFTQHTAPFGSILYTICLCPLD